MTAAMDYRVAIGSAVRDRLLANRDALKVPAEGLDLFVVRGFLTAEECDGLIELIDANRVRSTVLGPQNDPEYRTSDSCNMDQGKSLVQRVEEKVNGLMGIDPRHGETIQGQRYAVGQQFKSHHDFFYTTQAYWKSQENIGGQRTWTAMMFLNDVEEGGHTGFGKVGLEVQPRRGNLVAWNNLDAAGEPNMLSLHSGMPVKRGTKYIITKWYRERPWG